MGFDVDRVRKVVSVDHSHNNFATTSVEGNPRTIKYQGMTVVGIFKRNKGANRTLREEDPKAKIDGDNSPMLYALKNMDNLTTTQSDVRSLFRNARQILDIELTKHGLLFDYIVTIPSSHKLASVIARMTLRKCLKLGHPISTLDGVIQKSSAADVKAQILDLDIDRKLRTSMVNNVKKFIKVHGEATDFQIKYIQKIKLRKHVNLLTSVPGNGVDSRNINILLADDMVTTGSSLVAARDIVQYHFPNATIYSVCLFSASLK